MVIAQKPEMPAEQPESKERITEILNLKMEAKKKFDALNDFFKKMSIQAEKEYGKNKTTDAIQTDWQTPYAKFAESFLANEIDGALDFLKTMKINIGFDSMYRYFIDKGVSTKKWHNPAIDLIDNLIITINKFKEKDYSFDELKSVPMFLGLQQFKPEPNWSKSEKDRVEDMEKKVTAQNERRIAEKLGSALLLQEVLEGLEIRQEKERIQKGEYHRASKLERDINKETRLIKEKVLAQFDKLLNAINSGKNVEVSLEETLGAIPNDMLPNKTRKNISRLKKGKFSDLETIF